MEKGTGKILKGGGGAMELRKVTAIIRSSSLKQVEERLQGMNVKGLSVSNVKGYGEYANFFTHGWMITHSRIEIFTEKSNAERIALAIMEAAHTGVSGDGFIAILPVEKMYRIRRRAEARIDEI
jgi:nitrogen regulatory protein P-II 1